MAMYNIYYDFLITLMGTATEFPSTLIIVRYASIVLCFLTFWLLMSICFAMFKWIKSWF